ncbi:hypothetical protein BN1723_010376 [Verticillium longisporum]|uniref:Uncharacterized protein n=1 Tax=Verticillium longisporum TaxID=100787 RepID=A0A0G4KXW9_VERLO|nr:hypothetical protein HYQ46_004411 [Verticillium longisporum]CRK14546.1 hypothetical protein BN1723_010376 [Verticillium longisporum]CRK15998.1 hypothetical protein BN1708_011627 [Verticillium longisporum]
MTEAEEEGAKAIRGEEEDIISKIFPASSTDRSISLAQASYLRIFDKDSSVDWYDIKTTTFRDVPMGKETEVISGKKVKFC